MSIRRQRSGRSPTMAEKDPRARMDALAGLSRSDIGPGLILDRRGRVRLKAARDPGNHTSDPKGTTGEQVAALVDSHNSLLRELRAAGMIGG